MLFARVAWLAVALLSVSLFVAGVLVQWPELQRVCTEGAEVCAMENRSTSEEARELAEMGLPVGFLAAYLSALSVVCAAVWWTVGAVIFGRRSDDRMALLVSLMLVTLGATFGESGFAVLVAEYPALWLPVGGVQFLGDVCLALFFCLFPSGRFVPRWSRWLALAYLALFAPVYFFPGSPLDLVGQLGLFPPVVFAPFYAGFVGVQVYRYRRMSGPMERQQIRWVVFGVAAAFSGVIGVAVPLSVFSSPQQEGILVVLPILTAIYGSMLLVPLSIGVAMLRSRLFDVDVLINRTLVYGALTVSLIGTYVVSIVLLQTLLRALTGQTSQLAVVASTLAIAALFNPLRRRVQGFIDRRFYRKKYDAAKTLAAFNVTLRNETDLDALSTELLSVARETMQPEHASLWLKPPGR